MLQELTVNAKDLNDMKADMGQMRAAMLQMETILKELNKSLRFEAGKQK
jgi:hypothetical protein